MCYDKIAAGSALQNFAGEVQLLRTRVLAVGDYAALVDPGRAERERVDDYMFAA